VPFDAHGRLAPILRRRAALGPTAYVFGGPEGEYHDSFKTAWEWLSCALTSVTLRLPKRAAVSAVTHSAKSTCTGTTYDMKARAGCSPKGWPLRRLIVRERLRASRVRFAAARP